LVGNAGNLYGTGGMPGSQYTIAEMFKAGGYKTAHIGKWHMGYSPETMPNAQGFDYSFGFMGGCIDNYSHFYYWGAAQTSTIFGAMARKFITRANTSRI
jgi:arylsulfatase A